MRQLIGLFAAFSLFLSAQVVDATPASLTWNCHLKFVLASGRGPISGPLAIGGPGQFSCLDQQGHKYKMSVWLTVDVDILSPEIPSRSFNVRGMAEPIIVAESPSQLLGAYEVASPTRLVVAGASTPVTLIGGYGKPTLRTHLTVVGAPGTKLSLKRVLIKRENWR